MATYNIDSESYERWGAVLWSDCDQTHYRTPEEQLIMGTSHVMSWLRYRIENSGCEDKLVEFLRMKKGLLWIPSNQDKAYEMFVEITKCQIGWVYTAENSPNVNIEPASGIYCPNWKNVAQRIRKDGSGYSQVAKDCQLLAHIMKWDDVTVVWESVENEIVKKRSKSLPSRVKVPDTIETDDKETIACINSVFN